MRVRIISGAWLTRGGQTCEVGVGYEVSLSALTVDRLNATRHQR